MEDNYIIIMAEVLQKKLSVLEQIMMKNDEQTDILKEEQTDWDAFDRNADEKAELIDQMAELDAGFDRVFTKVEPILSSDEGAAIYRFQIKQMQGLIRQITEKSVSIQATEARNKQLVEQRFAQSHKKFGQSRNSSRIARDYYRNMQQTQVIAPAFLDKKN